LSSASFGIGADRVGGHRDGLQARRAEAVDRDAGGRLRQAGEQCRLAADIAGQVRDVTHVAVFDVSLVDAGTLDGVLDRVSGNGHRRSDVESAAARFC
jgi:hypothetical protein